MIHDPKLLNDFIKKLEKYFLHVPYSIRLKIFEDIKSDILADYEKESSKDFKSFIYTYRDLKSLSNTYLQKHGQKIYENKVNWTKVILISFLILFLSSIVGLYLFFKTFLPIFEIDENKGSIKLFGGRFDLGDEDFNSSNFTTKIYINGKEVKLEDLASPKIDDPNIKGDLDKKFIKSLSIKGEDLKAKIYAEDRQNLTYSCLSPDINPDFLKSDDGNIELNFNTSAQCDFQIPHNVSFSVNVMNGKVNLKNLKQDFSIKMSKGDLYWAQEEKTYYGLPNTKIVPDLNWSSKNFSPFKGEVSIDQGTFEIK